MSSPGTRAKSAAGVQSHRRCNSHRPVNIQFLWEINSVVSDQKNIAPGHNEENKQQRERQSGERRSEHCMDLCSLWLTISVIWGSSSENYFGRTHKNLIVDSHSQEPTLPQWAYSSQGQPSIAYRASTFLSTTPAPRWPGPRCELLTVAVIMVIMMMMTVMVMSISRLDSGRSPGTEFKMTKLCRARHSPLLWHHVTLGAPPTTTTTTFFSVFPMGWRPPATML